MELDFLIEHAKSAVRNAYANKSKVSEEILNMEGMSGQKTRHLYNNMANLPKGVYCEVGTWKGSSFCSAMYNNLNIQGYCIDNWSEYDAKEECISNIQKYLKQDNYQVIDSDCWNITQEHIKLPIDVYMYDGFHTHEDQKKGIMHFAKFFNKYVIIMVDDWVLDSCGVKSGTLDGIAEAGLIVHWSEDIGLVNTNEIHQGGDTFWNGCGIFVCERTDI